MNKTTRLLLAEDNADHRRLLLLTLANAKSSIDVSAVSNRDELLEKLKENSYDCLVMDFNLTPHTAPEVLVEAEEIIGDMPVIVISSSEAQQVVIESMRHGVSDFVPKDQAIENDVLVKRIETAIAQAREQRRERRKEKRRIESLKAAAETDPLTKLYNRRFADRLLRSDRFRRDRRSTIACVLLDLDHFKEINDTYGHAAGDEVLMGVSRVIRQSTFGNDIAIRWGGEEFLVLRYCTDVVDAWSWTDRLRRAIGDQRFSFGNGTLRVTISAGVTALPVTSVCDESVSLADAALYLSKETGRNRVSTWKMVEALEAASGVVCDGNASARQRIETFLSQYEAELGQTQAEYVGPHGEHVASIVTEFAKRMGCNDTELSDIELAGRIHDIGKIVIPESLLAKPEKLTDNEKRFVDLHAAFGAQLAEALGASKRVQQMVATHHDRYDQSTDAPENGTRDAMLCHMLCVADAIAAMTTDRPYAEPKTTDQVQHELSRGNGTQFDPAVVKIARDVSGWAPVKAA